jgi:outer membrane protein OmpA-like peptidoglycan-associated protein
MQASAGNCATQRWLQARRTLARAEPETEPVQCAPPADLRCPPAADSPSDVVSTLTFRQGSPALNAAQVAEIGAAAAAWNATGGGVPVRVDGYASAEGNCDFNWRLSAERALAIAAELQYPLVPDDGVPGSDIEAFAHGETAEAGAALAPNRIGTISIPLPPVVPVEPPPAPAETTAETVVVVIGSPSPGQLHKLQFVNAALRESGAEVIWYVERTGYELAGVDLEEITGQAPGALHWITPQTPLVDQLNALPRSSVARMVVYSHGVAGTVTLRYGWEEQGEDYGLDRSDARDIDGTVFSPDATIDLDSCQGGTNLDGGSLAQVIADTTGHDVSAWTGRTSYADVNAGTGPVRGSEYGLSRDAFREWYVRNIEAGDEPRDVTFRPQSR